MVNRQGVTIAFHCQLQTCTALHRVHGVYASIHRSMIAVGTDVYNAADRWTQGQQAQFVAKSADTKEIR